MLKIISIFLFTLFFSFSIDALDEQHIDAELLVVATQSHLLQYRENGEDKGSTIEMLQAILKESKLTAKVDFMPWARAFAIAKSQPNTLILSMIRTPAREQQFHWLIKVSNLSRVFISLAAKPENYASNLQQAKNKLIAVIRNTAEHKELVAKGFSEQQNLYIVSDTEQMLSLFIKGRAQLLYSDPDVVQDYLNNHSNTPIAIRYQVIQPENRRDSYIAANKDINKSVLSRLHAAAFEFQKSPEYFNLLTK